MHSKSSLRAVALATPLLCLGSLVAQPSRDLLTSSQILGPSGPQPAVLTQTSSSLTNPFTAGGYQYSFPVGGTLIAIDVAEHKSGSAHALVSNTGSSTLYFRLPVPFAASPQNPVTRNNNAGEVWTDLVVDMSPLAVQSQAASGGFEEIMVCGIDAAGNVFLERFDALGVPLPRFSPTRHTFASPTPATTAHIAINPTTGDVSVVDNNGNMYFATYANVSSGQGGVWGPLTPPMPTAPTDIAFNPDQSSASPTRGDFVVTCRTVGSTQGQATRYTNAGIATGTNPVLMGGDLRYVTIDENGDHYFLNGTSNNQVYYLSNPSTGSAVQFPLPLTGNFTCLSWFSRAATSGRRAAQFNALGFLRAEPGYVGDPAIQFTLRAGTQASANYSILLSGAVFSSPVSTAGITGIWVDPAAGLSILPVTLPPGLPSTPFALNLPVVAGLNGLQVYFQLIDDSVPIQTSGYVAMRFGYRPVQ